MNTRLISPSAMLTVALLCAIMCAAGFLIMPQHDAAAQGFGLVFPSPDLWAIEISWGEIINAAVIGLCAPAVFMINKHFSLLKSSLPFWALFYLPLTCSNLPVSGHLTGNLLLLPVTLLIFVSLFNSYRSRNATRNAFFIATCISVGSMFQQAFIPFIVAVVIGGFMMKSMRIREFIALILGVISPYWVLFGLGIIGIDDFSYHPTSNIFTSPIGKEQFPVLVGCGVAMVTALLLSLYNAIKLYAGNSQIRAYNYVVNIFGFTALLAMMFDLDNMYAYIGVFNLWVGLQFANLFTLWNLHKPIWVFWLIQATIFSFAVILYLYL